MTTHNKTDVCVIGSGAGGGVVAKELAEQGFSVVLLEAGRRYIPEEDYIDSTTSQWDIKANHDKFQVKTLGDFVNAGKNPVNFLRGFGVGGTTLKYLGYTIRLLPDDFRVRTLDGVADDWPITYEDLAPYYTKVEQTLGVSGLNKNPWFPPIPEYPNPPFEFSYANKVFKRGCDKMNINMWPAPRAVLSRASKNRAGCIRAGVCTSGCIRRAKSSVDVSYIPLAEATGRFELKTNSVAVKIECDNKGRAKRVIYSDHEGNLYSQEAHVIILAAGTIHTPRLLLASASSQFPDGLGNSSGVVGKYLMDHGDVEVHATFNERIDSFRGIPGGAISLDFSRTNKQNNFTRGWLLQFTGGYAGPVSAALQTKGWGVKHKQAMQSNFGYHATIKPNCEQLPDQRNRVELDSNKVDAFGIPLARITLEPRENELKLYDAAVKQAKDICSAAGAIEITGGRISPSSNSHAVGTCRMGNNPSRSVINGFCQSHDIPNLFITDGSCFVTIGTSNPSLTIQALATRAAHYLGNELKRGNI